MTEYSVTAVPTFAVVQGGGEVRNRSGWDEEELADDIVWLESD